MLFQNPSLSYCAFIALAGMTLSGCGGGSSSTTTAPGGSGTRSNIALSSAGASINSSYAGNENFVIDGDTTTTNFWEAGANGDTLTIDFSESYNIDTVTIYHAGMNSNAYFSIEFSIDDISYTSINNITDCSVILHFGATDYSCGFGTAVDARYLRLTILDNFENIDIHEIEVMGQ